MNTSYKISLLTLALLSTILLSSYLLSPKKKNPILKNTTFHLGGFNSSYQLELEENTFKYFARSLSCTSKAEHITEVEGTFKQENNRIYFTPTKKITKDYQDSSVTVYNPKKVYQLNGIFEIWLIDSTIALIQVDPEILLEYPTDIAPKNGYTIAANNINRNGRTSIGAWSTCKGRDCQILDISSKSYFPKPWRDYILEDPIEAKIIDTEALSSGHKLFSPYIKYSVTIDKGSDQGLKKGMRLTSDQANIYLYQIDKNSSKGYFHYHNAKEYLKKDMTYYSKREL